MSEHGTLKGCYVDFVKLGALDMTGREKATRTVVAAQ